MKSYLFIFGLLNDAVSTSDFITLNNMMAFGSVRTWKEAVVAFFKALP